jgi:hypothetical protein
MLLNGQTKEISVCCLVVRGESIPEWLDRLQERDVILEETMCGMLGVQPQYLGGFEG